MYITFKKWNYKKHILEKTITPTPNFYKYYNHFKGKNKLVWIIRSFYSCITKVLFLPSLGAVVIIFVDFIDVDSKCGALVVLSTFSRDVDELSMSICDVEISPGLDVVLSVVEWSLEKVALLFSVNVESNVSTVVPSDDVFVNELDAVDPSLDVRILCDVVNELSVEVNTLFSDTVVISDAAVTLCEVKTFCGVVVWISGCVVSRLML